MYCVPFNERIFRMILKLLFTLALFLALALTGTLQRNAEAFTGDACGTDCTSCHKLTKEEASILLKTEKFKATIKDIRISEVKGLWQVTLDANGKTIPVYIDFAKKYLVEGRFTEIKSIGAPKELRKVDRDSIPLEDAIVLGDHEAPNKVIVFDDPDCPYCKKLHVEIKKILKSRDDIVFFIKQYPLPIHPKAYKKSMALVCNQSPSLLDDAFEGKNIGAPTCATDVVDKNIKLAKKLGIGGTPAIILPDGRLLPGYVDAETLEGLIGNGIEVEPAGRVELPTN